MATISEIRKQYPQYEDMSDRELSDALYRKHYSDMPRGEFNAKIGLGHNVPEFHPVGVENYDPQTGMVADSQGPQSQSPRTLTATMGAIEGLPVVGPYARHGVEAGAAALGSAISGQPYGQVRSEMGGMVEGAQQQHPYFNTAGRVAGGVAGTLPMVMAAPGLFGAGAGPLGAGLGGRTVMSGLSGAGLGAADAGTRSGFDPGSMATGAAYGGAVGAVSPLAGELLGAGTRAIFGRYGRGTPAQQQLARAAGADAVDDMGARIAAMGDDAMPMDLGPNLQRQAGDLASRPGEAQQIVRSAIGARDAGANQRIMSAIDDNLGPAVIPSEIEATIAANKQALGTAYDDVLRGAKRVDTKPIADNLDAAAVRLRGGAQKAVQQVRKMLNITGNDVLDPDPATLLQTRHAIDGIMETADSKTINVLKVVRQQVDKELARAAPGIKKVDARWQELALQEKALARGQQTLDSGRTAPRPSELADDMSKGAVPQGNMAGPSAVPMRLRQGARAEIDRIVGTNANDRVALQRLIKGEGDWNRSRLATLFGKEKAERIIHVLDRERAFADTSQIVTRNSETAARQAARPQKADRIIRDIDVTRPLATVGKIKDRLLGASDRAVQEGIDTELAQLLTSNDPQSMTRVIKSVQAAQRRGDISAQRAKEIIQSFALGGQTQVRKPLEITVRPLGISAAR